MTEPKMTVEKFVSYWCFSVTDDNHRRMTKVLRNLIRSEKLSVVEEIEKEINIILSAHLKDPRIEQNLEWNNTMAYIHKRINMMISGIIQQQFKAKLEEK